MSGPFRHHGNTQGKGEHGQTGTLEPGAGLAKFITRAGEAFRSSVRMRRDKTSLFALIVDPEVSDPAPLLDVLDVKAPKLLAPKPVKKESRKGRAASLAFEGSAEEASGKPWPGHLRQGAEQGDANARRGLCFSFIGSGVRRAPSRKTIRGRSRRIPFPASYGHRNAAFCA